MRTILIALVVFPLAAAAQSGGGAGGQERPEARGRGAEDRGGPRGGHGHGDPERFARRMRVARTLGLAEALDLEPGAAVKLGEQLQANDERRHKVHEQLHTSMQTLRRAAGGEKVTSAEVDQAIQRLLAARGQLEALDREAVQSIVKDLSPERRARAVLFMERFQRRFGEGFRGRELRGRMTDGMGHGPGHRGMGPGMGGDMEWDDDG